MLRRTAVLAILAACGGGSNDSNSGGDFYAIPLTTVQELFWMPNVTVGSQTFAMDLDTGSTTTGIAGSTCSSCNVTPEYMPGATATDQMQSSQTQYADNSGWSGEIYKDGLMVGSASPETTFDLVDITDQTSFFDGNAYQGILGMGAPQNAEPGTGAYFTALVATGVRPVMAFELCPDGGTMWLGGYDDTHAANAMQYTPMIPISNNNPFYAIDVTALSLGSASIATGSAAFQEPVIDTGTTGFYLPTDVESAMIGAINASAGAQALFPGITFHDDPNFASCSNASSVTDAQVDAMLPAMNITMPGIDGGAPITLEVPPLLSYMYDAGNGQFCLGIGNGGSQFGSTFGDQFMQAFVTVIDVGDNQIGFALDAGCNTGTSHRRVSHDLTTLRPHLPKRGMYAPQR